MHFDKAFFPTWKTLRVFAALMLLVAGVQAQSRPQPAGAAKKTDKPKFQLSFVNSCRPTPAAVGMMRQMLIAVNRRPRFGTDFEISRGLTTLTAAEARAEGLSQDSVLTPSPWVRIRREFPDKELLTDAQYTVSVEGGAVGENLALHLRNTDKALEVLLSTSAVGSVRQMLGADTPPDRIQVERFGKSSLVLSRCANSDQSQYEPIFRLSSEIMNKYRAAMAIRTVVPVEMARIPAAREARGQKKGSKRSAGQRRH